MLLTRYFAARLTGLVWKKKAGQAFDKDLVVEQLTGLKSNVLADVWRRGLNLDDDLWPPVDDRHDVLEIVTREDVLWPRPRNASSLVATKNTGVTRRTR